MLAEKEICLLLAEMSELQLIIRIKALNKKIEMYLLQYAEDEDERPASWPASQIVARRVSTNVKALKNPKIY